MLRQNARPLLIEEMAPIFHSIIDFKGQRSILKGNAGKILHVPITCPQCSNIRMVVVRTIRDNISRFTGVCRSCLARSKFQEINSKPTPRRDTMNRYVNPKGYVFIYMPNHPMARKHGYIPEHRLVMSNVLGRSLFSYESVHHKNGVRSDNRPENLELWLNQPSGQRAQEKSHCPTCTCFISYS